MAQAMATGATSTNTPAATFGRLLLDVTEYPTHRAMRVYAGADELPALAYASADDREFTARYQRIATAATNGQHPDDIALLIAQDVAEAELVKATADGDLARVAQLNALIPTLMTVEQQQIAARFADVKTVDDIKVDDRAPNFAALRDKHNAERHYELKTIRANVAPKPTTDAQRRLFADCAKADGHTVKVGEHLAATMRAAWRNGMGELVRGGASKFEVTGFVANVRALREVGA